MLMVWEWIVTPSRGPGPRRRVLFISWFISRTTQAEDGAAMHQC